LVFPFHMSFLNSSSAPATHRVVLIQDSCGRKLAHRAGFVEPQFRRPEKAPPKDGFMA
jgi:hypothetical protein